MDHRVAESLGAKELDRAEALLGGELARFGKIGASERASSKVRLILSARGCQC